VDFKEHVVLGVLRCEMSMAAAARRHGVGSWPGPVTPTKTWSLEPEGAPDPQLTA
jgi:hypothetical protein